MWTVPVTDYYQLGDVAARYCNKVPSGEHVDV